MGLPDSYQTPRIRYYLGGCLRGLSLSLTGLSPSAAPAFQQDSASHSFFNSTHVTATCTTTPATPDAQRTALLHTSGLGSFPFARHYLGSQFFFSFPSDTKMSQFSPFASLAYLFSQGYLNITPGGFPHSDTSGSQPVGSSPKLFVACYVLLRFLAPKHPPCTLNILNLSFLSLSVSRFQRSILLEMTGIEPAAFSVQARRSPPELHPLRPYGPEWTRTTDLLLIRQTL